MKEESVRQMAVSQDHNKTSLPIMEVVLEFKVLLFLIKTEIQTRISMSSLVQPDISGKIGSKAQDSTQIHQNGEVLELQEAWGKMEINMDKIENLSKEVAL